jgi:S-adenosylmethionine:tRNA ribosyltransferase-isomerase
MVFSVVATPQDLQLDAYDYELPPSYIAQNPMVPRDHSRLLVVENPVQRNQDHHHCHFYQLPDWLKPGDLLVLNDTHVIPARLYGHKQNNPKQNNPKQNVQGGERLKGTSVEGAPVEVLLLQEKGENCWLALVKPGRRLKPGATIAFGPTSESRTSESLTATVLANDSATGGRLLQFQVPDNTHLWDWIETLGQVPLPPYITASQAQPHQYQTVYHAKPGAIAAPTAGLHFTPELLQTLQDQGIDHTFITLHVGVGTFRPVETATISAHQMHGEWVEVPEATVAKIRQTQAQGGRIIAVGTTVVRSLEGAAQLSAQSGQLQPWRGEVNLFIYPGYQWRVVQGLITNFHLPRSSLLMLVSALIGRPRLLSLYRVAIEHHYRFYSFGDAMLILPRR